MSLVAKRRPRPSRPERRGLASWTIHDGVDDLDRVPRTSFVTEAGERERRRANPCILSHAIQHGMSLPGPRTGCGLGEATTALAVLKIDPPPAAPGDAR